MKVDEEFTITENVKAMVVTFNQEKAVVGAFSVPVKSSRTSV